MLVGFLVPTQERENEMENWRDEMLKTLDAIFDGEVLCLEEPVALEPNIRVRVTIETPEGPHIRARSFFETARSLNLEGPSDWSARFEDTLYGREIGADN